MRFIFSVILAVMLLVPIFVSAAECNGDGYTVVFVNGVGNTEAEARFSKNELQRRFLENTGRTDVEFLLGYNPSHYATGGDLIKSGFQIRSSPGNEVQDHDLVQILNDLSPKIRTQRLALVGHSQGTFYTNAMHEYLSGSGVPPASLGIYNVATPAHYVAGGGPYLTSSNDGIITSYVEFAAKFTFAPRPLPANIMIPLDQAVDPKGHSFTKTYLPGASRTILGTLSTQLASLAAFPSREDRECYAPPPEGFVYKAKDVVYGVSDFVIGFAVDSSGKIAGLVVDTVKLAASLAVDAVQLAASLAVSTGNALIGAANTLWGWGGAALAEVQSWFGGDNELVSASLFALLPHEGQTDWPLPEPPAASPTPPPAGEVLGEITLPQPGPRAELPPAAPLPPAFSLPPAENIASPPIEEDIGPPETPTVEPGPSENPEPEPEPEPPPVPPAPPPSPPGGGSPIPPALASVRINEVAWAGTVASSTDEWFELRNLGVDAVNLADWKLEGFDGNDAENDPGVVVVLSGMIPAGGVFLIERTADTTVADISADLVAAFGDGLSNLGERLELRDSFDRLVDSVEPVRDEAGIPTKWLEGNNDAKATMARNADGSWFTSSAPTCPAHDAAGNAIVGTPRAANDATEVVACPPPPVSVLLTIAEASGGTLLQFPDIVAGDESFLVSWSDAAGGTARVWAQRVSAAGGLLDVPQLLAVEVAADPRITRTAFHNGIFLITWSTGGFGGEVRGIRMQEDGTLIDAVPVVLYTSDLNQITHPEVVVPFGEDAFLVFLQRRDYMSSITVPAHDTPLTEADIVRHDILVNNRFSLINGAACRGATCLLVWMTGYGVYYLAISTDLPSWQQPNFATPGTPLMLLGEGLHQGEQVFGVSWRSVVVTPEGFLVVWSRDAALFAQRFDGEGVALGEPTALSPEMPWLAIPFLAARGDGTFLVTGALLPLGIHPLANATQNTLVLPPLLIEAFVPVTEQVALTLSYAPAACLDMMCAHAWVVLEDAFSPPAAIKVFVGE